MLGIPKEDFYRETSPTWKQGIKFIWGPRDHFFYTFDFQYDQQRPGMPMANGFYADVDCSLLDLPAALIQNDKAFAAGPLGKPLINGQYAFQIEHENWINRGYVYASAFISDEDALREFLTKNPKVSNKPRLVPFRSGRYERSWVGNVLAVGNASGFVEPLEATALAQLIFEVRWFVEKLRITGRQPDEAARADYNMIVGRAWDEIRDFLAYHYKFNTRLDTPFWRHCREKTSLGDFEDTYQAYRRLGPSPKTIEALPYKPNIYGIEGYLTMLVGMRVP